MAIVLFDGTCNFCNGAVRFIIANDPAGRFRFAASQSDAGRAVLAACGRRDGPQGSILLVEGDRVFARSDATLRIAAELAAPWTLARFLLAVPEAWRDRMYDFVSANRYRVFGRREACALPNPALSDRFL